MPISLKENLWLIAAVPGVVVGVGLMLAAVAVGTLIFGVYGYGLFLLTPFVIGIITAYIANYKGDIGSTRTLVSVMVALAIGSVGLVLVALEGIVCIAMAAPLGVAAAWFGGEVGRVMALRGKRSQMVSCIALVPLVFAVEYVLPASTRFDTVQTIEVHAPPEAVWRSILSTDPVEGAARAAVPARRRLSDPQRNYRRRRRRHPPRRVLHRYRDRAHHRVGAEPEIRLRRGRGYPGDARDESV